MLTVVDRGREGKICQNLADVICERSFVQSDYRQLNVSFNIIM